MIGEVDISKQGGLDIQGIINQYQIQAGENISAGDFVEFVNSYSADGDYQINNTNYSGSFPIVAVALTNEKILVSSNRGKKLCLYTINGSTITAGNLVSASTEYENNSISLKKITNDKALLFAIEKSGSSYYLKGKIISVNEETITIGTEKSIESSLVNSYADVSIINENKFIAVFCKSNRYILYAKICNISGTSITFETSSTNINNNSNSGMWMNKIEYLTNNRALVIGGANANTQTEIIEISNEDTISYISAITNSATTGVVRRSVKVDNNTVACFFGESNSGNYYLNAVIVSCVLSNGAYITQVGTIVDLRSTTGLDNYNTMNASNQSPILIKENTVFFPHLHKPSSLATTTFMVSGISITNINTVLLLSADATNTCPLLTNDWLFIFYSQGATYLMTYKYNINHKIKLLSQKIDGVSQEDGSGGDTIDVIKPYTS